MTINADNLTFNGFCWVWLSEYATDGAEAVAAAMSGQGTNLIVPADFAWSETAGGAAAPIAPEPWPQASADAVAQAAAALKSGDNACLFIGGKAQRAEGLALAHRISAATGARVIAEVFPARIQRGRGRLAPERLPYFGEMAADYLKDFAHIVLIGAQAPVSWVQLAGGMGVAASRATTVAEFQAQFEEAMATAGPRLIEVML